jgi:hypothetical protein
MSASPWLLVVVVTSSILTMGLGRLVRAYRWLRTPLLVVVAFAGGWYAFDAISQPHGYAAAYVNAAVWLIALMVAVGSLPLLAFSAVRKAGLLGLAVSVVLLIGFYATYFVGLLLRL